MISRSKPVCLEMRCLIPSKTHGRHTTVREADARGAACTGVKTDHFLAECRTGPDAPPPANPNLNNTLRAHGICSRWTTITTIKAQITKNKSILLWQLSSNSSVTHNIMLGQDCAQGKVYHNLSVGWIMIFTCGSDDMLRILKNTDQNTIW